MRFYLWVALLAVSGTLVVPSSAHAVISPVRYDETSSIDGQEDKEVVLDCPDGQKAHGVGGKVNLGLGHVMLTSVVPDPNLDYVTVTARARSGYRGHWSLTAYVVCHDPGGYPPVRATGVGTQEATAECPDQTIVYSPGFRLAPGGTTFVDKVVPAQDFTQVDVHANAGPVVAIAICGPVLPPRQMPYRAQRIQASATASPTELAERRPPPSLADFGSWVFGAGADVTGPGNVLIDGLGVNEDLDTAWAGMARRQTGIQAIAARQTGDDDEWEGSVYGTLIGWWY